MVELKSVGILTKRQIEVMNLVKLGYMNKQIGERLGISINTVKEHTVRIARRMRASDRTHTVYLCMKRGIID